jgi:hypothetical protein
MAPKKSSLYSLFDDYSTLDLSVRSGVILLTIVFILLCSSVFEISYPMQIVELYAVPWWRFLVVLLVVIGTWWCPRVGFVLALAAFFYLNDMHILTSSFVGKA